MGGAGRVQKCHVARIGQLGKRERIACRKSRRRVSLGHSDRYGIVVDGVNHKLRHAQRQQAQRGSRGITFGLLA